MRTKAIDDVLREHHFFAGLDDADLDFIAGCGRTTVYRARTMVHVEGDEAVEFFVVRRGRFAIETHGALHEPVVLETVGPGSVVGWSWLFPPHKWRFDVRAVDEVHAIALDGACLRQKCEDDPRLGVELMRRFAGLMAERLEAARLQLLDVYGARDG